AITVISAILISTLLKWTTGLYGWSGKGVSPMYGDFEAQRHWIEITLHLPASQWYFYDLSYWGLDYPPLTAKVSKWCGQAASYFPRVAEHFALDKSRGTEANEVALFMRATVLVLDTLLYVPAILFFLNRRLQGRGRRTRAIAILTVLLQPSTILVDHGHFQYNTVMLGLSAFAFSLLYTSLPNPDLGIAAVFFSLSLSFKQMALYYAPAVFAIMLGRCVGLARIGFERGLICFTGIGLATIITFAIVFREWLRDINQLGQIIHRIFPVARGLFEDKVSNIWCFSSVLPLPAKYKLRNALSIDSLARLSLATTLLVILLPCAHLFAAAAETVHIEMFLDEDSKRQVLASEKRQKEGSIVGGSSISGRRPRHLSQAAPAPSEAVLPYALLSTSLAFFLFGFQTHEKSILIPLLPMTLLISVKADEWGGGAGKTDWEWAILMNNVSLFSMWPLLQRDGLVWQYVLLSVGWNWAIGYRPFNGLQSYRKSFVAWAAAIIHLGMLALHSFEIILPHLPSIAKPIFSRYPDIFPVLNVLLCTPVFGLIWLWSTKRQLEVGFASG
ncbi:ALG6, ALG8 glycosyltransferase, partial [Meira miltonrushii]